MKIVVHVILFEKLVWQCSNPKSNYESCLGEYQLQIAHQKQLKILIHFAHYWAIIHNE